MPAEVFFDVWSVQSPVIEARMPGEASYPVSAYPHPYLAIADGLQSQELPVVILENEACRVTICPALGGRVVGWFDKRLRRHAIRLPEVIGLVADGPRGAWWPYGIRLETSTGPLASDLAPVQWQAVYPGEDDDPAGVWMAGLASDGWSWHLAYALDASAPSLSVEVRVQNRSDAPIAIDPVLSMFGEGRSYAGGADGRDWLTHWNDGWFLIEAVGDVPLESTPAGGPGRIHFGPSPVRPTLAPYQTDSWSLRLHALPSLGEPWHVTAELAIGFRDGGVAVYAERAVPNARVSIQLDDGTAQSATASLVPEQVWAAELGDLAERVTAVGVQNAAGDLLAMARRPEIGEPAPSRARTGELGEPWRPLPPELALRIPGRQHAAWVALADAAIREGDWETARGRLERATGFQGEDALTWWRLALAHRYLRRAEGRPATEADPALENAFYLAPLEPRLRAEQFLTASEDATGEADPTGLLKPLAAMPHALVDVAVAYLELGLRSDALLWLSAALELAEGPLLRALRAATYRQLGLEMEAMADAQHADRQPIQPPFPIGAARAWVREAADSTRSRAFATLLSLDPAAEPTPDRGTG
ncbi:MAG: DUF5107 domain-containing protein [Fimbriimonadaceae bacterium]|nr:DUF5107 domain-containing protein [Fimbriimonadaceae bacterium]